MFGDHGGRRAFHRADGDPPDCRPIRHGLGDAASAVRKPERMGDWSLALLIAWLGTAVILFLLLICTKSWAAPS